MFVDCRRAQLHAVCIDMRAGCSGKNLLIGWQTAWLLNPRRCPPLAWAQLWQGLMSNMVLTRSCWLQNERVLFHYNGHGVPRPTANGEIWVFNKSYTQYIPMSVYDLQAWVSTPCMFVFDCSAAGLIVNSFRAFSEQRMQVMAPICLLCSNNCSNVSHLHAGAVCGSTIPPL